MSKRKRRLLKKPKAIRLSQILLFCKTNYQNFFSFPAQIIGSSFVLSFKLIACKRATDADYWLHNAYSGGSATISDIPLKFRPATKEEAEGLYPLTPEEGKFIERYKKTKILSEGAFINLISSALIQKVIL